MSTYSIERVGRADLEAIARLIMAAKLALTINRLLWKEWPNYDMQRANCLKAVGGSFEDPACDLWKAVDGRTGEIVGHLVTTRRKPVVSVPPRTAEKEKKEDGGAAKMEVPPHFDAGVLDMVMSASVDIDAEVKDLDYLEITFIIITPGHRGRGIGSKLMGLAFESARAAGIPIATKAEPAAYGFLKSVGFKETKHADFDLTRFAAPNSGFGNFRLAGVMWRP